MKKIYFLIILFFTTAANAQNTDSLVSLIFKEKTDSSRIHRFYSLYEQLIGSDPAKAIEGHQQLLELAKKNKSRIMETIVLSELGDLFAMAGATVQGTRVLLDAVKMAEATGNPQVIGIAYQNLAVATGDPVKSKEYNQKAFHYSSLAGDPIFTYIELRNFGSFYMHPEHFQLDSALYYAERSYRFAIAQKIDPKYYAASLLLLSKIHLKSGNDSLALRYIRSVENLACTQADNIALSSIYRYYTDYYLAIGKKDSAIFYANESLDFTKHSFILYRQAPANALRLLYAGRNTDSALKYTNLYDSIKDSLSSVQALQQVQAMTFEETRRQEKLEEERLKAKEERRHNLQYAGIAIGFIVFAILFLLFSHSVIAGPRLIKNLGILSLLIVFEFFNLLIHPYLEELTHHSPVIMLGFLVCLAALLIPLHHKLEHWVIHKLTEKNNKIRLAKTKQTIEHMEKKDDMH